MMGIFGDDTSFTDTASTHTGPTVPVGWSVWANDPNAGPGQSYGSSYFLNQATGQRVNQQDVLNTLGQGANSLGKVINYEDPNSWSNQNFDLIANNMAALQQGNTTPLQQAAFMRAYANNPNTVLSDPTQYMMGGNPLYAQNAANGLNLQAVGYAGQQAPTINTAATNMIAGGAGNSLNQANATDLYGMNAGLQLAGTANGAAAQGQLGTAQQLSNAANGAGYVGGMMAANGLMGAASGPAAAGQLASANALMGAANGPALGAQFGTAAQLANAANGQGVQGQYALGNQLAASAYGSNAANQSALANQLAGTAYGQTMQGQLGYANQLAAAGKLPTGPSVAELQLQQGANQSMAQQMAMASTARGGNTALALQNAGQNEGQAMGQLNQSTALLRAQEDMQNRQLQASTLGQAAGLYGQATGQQQQALGAAAGLYGNLQGQQAAALQGAGNLYGNAGGLSGNLLSSAQQGFGNVAGTQANILSAANQGYGGAANTQGNLFGAAGQQYTASGNLQGNLLGASNQGFTSALGGQQNAYNGAGNIFQGVAQNQLGQANTQAGVANMYAGLASDQAQLQQQQMAQNAASSLNAQQLANQYMAQQLQATQNYDQNRTQNQANILTNQYANRNRTGEGTITGSGGGDKALFGGLQAIGTIGALSDVRAKKNIAPAQEAVSDTYRMQLPPAPAYSYLYKDPNAAGAKPGVQYGPMAQDLEKTPAGASVVGEQNGKKTIDTSRLSLLNTSELSKQRQEIDALTAALDQTAPIGPQQTRQVGGQTLAPGIYDPWSRDRAELAGLATANPYGDSRSMIYGMAPNPYTAPPAPAAVASAPGQLAPAAAQARKIRTTQVAYPQPAAPSMLYGGQ